MGYQEEPEEKKDDYAFLQETIKDENGGHNKLRNIVLKYAGLGLVFGLAACIGFCALKPWAEEKFAGNPQKITIPEEEEEETEAEGQGETQEAQTLTVEDYEEMNRALINIGNTVNRSIVEIRAEGSGKESDEEPAVSSAAGVLFEDNGTELLILGSSRVLSGSANITVKLADGKTYPASLKKRDDNLGIAVLAVAKNTVPESTWNQIQIATLGSSNSILKGEVILALGSPFGYYGGMGIGIAASTANRVMKYDGQYDLICTDIPSSQAGTGILADTDGQIVGIIDQTLLDEEGQGQVIAYGISDLKKAVEFLSNNKAVPYLGILSVTVTEDLAEQQGLPEGIYVQEVAADSPAMKAGIQSGDVITRIGKTSISTLSGYTNALMELDAGKEIKVEGKRQGNGGYVDIDFTVAIGSKE